MMKFALFLVCALVAVQGYSARSVEPTQRDLSDIVDAIKNAIEKMKEIIGNITAQIPKIIQDIKDKISEIGGKIENIVAGIKQKIQDLIALGEAGKKCVEENKGEIEALVDLAQSGMKGCVDEAKSKTDALDQQVKTLLSKAEDLRDDIVARVNKCVSDSGLNPIALYNCMKKQVDPIKQQVEEVSKEVVNTVNVAKETAQIIGKGLAECSQKVSAEVEKKQDEVIEKIQECIAQNTY